jgi:hypothetical protein
VLQQCNSLDLFIPESAPTVGELNLVTSFPLIVSCNDLNKMSSQKLTHTTATVPGIHVEPALWVIEAAAVMAIVCSPTGGGKAPDWQDFSEGLTITSYS